MPDLSIDTHQVRRILVDFIRREVSQAGYQRGVVNLSGGLDSALACTLAADALGAPNVLALCLPYRSSSPDSLAHAQLVIDALGVPSITLPITEMVEPLFRQFPQMSPVRRGNVMARARMIVLYDQSAAFNGLPIGTGNKTEILLGYTTIYGDAACALNPLGDLYKTQVRQLAQAVGLPEVILAKPPSADLWEGQTDEGELGFTYAEVDRLLFLLVEQGFTPAECVQAGFAEGFVSMVVERIRRSQYKRSLPPVGKISKPQA